MILKGTNKIAIKKSQKTKKFLISYFIFTSLVGILFLIFVFTSHAAKKKTAEVLYLYI